MKAQGLSALAALVGIATTGPATDYHLAQARDVANLDTSPDMTFTGPLQVGGPERHAHGHRPVHLRTDP